MYDHKVSGPRLCFEKTLVLCNRSVHPAFRFMVMTRGRARAAGTASFQNMPWDLQVMCCQQCTLHEQLAGLKAVSRSLHAIAHPLWIHLRRALVEWDCTTIEERRFHWLNMPRRLHFPNGAICVVSRQCVVADEGAAPITRSPDSVPGATLDLLARFRVTGNACWGCGLVPVSKCDRAPSARCYWQDEGTRQ